MQQAEAVIAALKQRGLTIGSCESFTAGAFCARLADVAGASAVLKGGIVTYATELKCSLANVDKALLAKYGVISAQCAEAMAVCARKVLDVDICVSFTGNAGPDAWEGKPAGLIYCAIADADTCRVYEQTLNLSRNALRDEAVDFMLDQLAMYVNVG